MRSHRSQIFNKLFDVAEMQRLSTILKHSGVDMLLSDLRGIHERDPAARNCLEVLFCYPGLQALILYRLAHWLFILGIPFFPRLISHIGRCLTGVEIHPGATIGKGVFIDHGMGIVIGETAIVGDYALIYEGVTLGGTGKETGKRHPTLDDYVILGSGAKVLGNIQIGNHVRIGAGSVVLRNVPSHCTVVGVPGRIIHHQNVTEDVLARGSWRDVEAEVIQALFERVRLLEAEVQQLQTQPLRERVAQLSNGHSSHDVVVLHDAQTSHRRSGQDLLIEEFLNGAGI